MATYRLTNGNEPGAYGRRRVMLEATGNELPDLYAEPLVASGVIEVEPEKTKRTKKKARRVATKEN